MSTYCPVSNICFVACAKRASSRSTGGIWKKPGRKAISAKATSSAAARACEPLAQSSAAISPRAGATAGGASSVVVLMAAKSVFVP